MNSQQEPREQRNIPSSEEMLAQLTMAEVDTNLDDYIDLITENVFLGLYNAEISSILMHALKRAHGALSRRSAALALAVSAEPNNQYAVDALILMYQQHLDDPYMRASLLEALSILALRSPLAYMEIASALLRLNTNDSSYVLIKAAKIIGRLENYRSTPELRSKLKEWSSTEDLSVQSEVQYQLGLITLADALLSPTSTQLYEQFVDARTKFAYAEATTEHRPDAAMFVLLLDILLTLDGFVNARTQKTEQIAQYTAELEKALLGLWRDYRTPAAELLAVRVLSIADALKRTVLSANRADDWTNFDAALIELATIYSIISTQTQWIEGHERCNQAIGAIADRVLAPQLGPVLLQAIGRRRLAIVIDNYVATHGDDATAAGLRALEQATTLNNINEQTEPLGPQLAQLAAQYDETTRRFLQNFTTAVTQNSVDRFLQEMGLGSTALPIDQPGLYGADVHVNQIVRRLLQDIRNYLTSYSQQKWYRLAAVVESIVSFTQYVRDILPDYTRCLEDAGKGQEASEEDLQEHLFEVLRSKFNRNVIYEYQRIGGGRPDTVLKFEEVMFPIEVKHEFSSIEQQHVHNMYITQADIYAAATDNISFLMILDLRTINGAGHKTRTASRRRQGQPSDHVSLYTLDESFWLDGLPSDPQILHSAKKAVIVGLIPGNRPRPSSTTTYSRRPKNKIPPNSTA